MAERCRVVFGAMWGGESETTHVGDEPSGVVALVPSHGASPGCGGQSGQHLDGGGPLGVAVGGGELGVDDQGVAMLHEQVPRVAQHGRRPP